MKDVGFEEREGVLVVRPAMARLDALVAPDFRDAVLARLQPRAQVVVDLAAVRFVDSTGLAALISILKRLPPGGGLKLANVSDSVASLLKLTRLHRVFGLYPSVGEALSGAAP